MVLDDASEDVIGYTLRIVSVSSFLAHAVFEIQSSSCKLFRDIPRDLISDPARGVVLKTKQYHLNEYLNKHRGQRHNSLGKTMAECDLRA